MPDERYIEAQQTTAATTAAFQQESMDLGDAGGLELSPRLRPAASQNPERTCRHGVQDRATVRIADGPFAGDSGVAAGGPQPDHSREGPKDHSRDPRPWRAPPTEFNGLPGFEERGWGMPWYRRDWRGRRPPDVWSPLTWDGRTWCRDVLALDPCAYCGGAVEVIDHIHAKAHGGENHWTNVIGACRTCNIRKGAKPLLFALLRDRERGLGMWAS